MKKFLTVLAVLSLATMAAVPSFAAVDLKGKWGLGYQRPVAPVGARIWLSEKIGLDLGVGFASSNDNPSGDNVSSFAVDLGMPYVIANTGNTNFYVRPGFGYESGKDVQYNPTTLQYDKFSNSTWWLSGTLGVEHFLSDNFSLQAAHGVVYASHDSDIPNYKAVNTFTTEDFGISSIGFHYYFGGSK